MAQTSLCSPSAIGFPLYLLTYFISITFMLLGVAFLSLFERKLMGVVQYRLGPNKVSSLYGSLQPFSDAVKLASKQNPLPSTGESILYSISPIMMCVIYLNAWAIPFTYVCLTNKGLIILLSLLSCSALWQVMSGWAANSAYSLVGSMRAIAQSISFEIIMSMSIITFMLLSLSGMSNILEEMKWMGSLNLIAAFLLLLALLAESGRSPFDLPEGESELVGGYLVDYGGGLYKLIFLAENLSCLLIAGILSMICIGPLSWIKCLMVLLLVVITRATMPRVSFRDMMPLVWITFMPPLISSLSMSALLL
nr:NADH dehydrogenase subunit 1 [Hoplopleura edentula]